MMIDDVIHFFRRMNMFYAYRHPTNAGWLGWFADAKGMAIAFVDLDQRVTFLHGGSGRECELENEPIPPIKAVEASDEREANPPLVLIKNLRVLGVSSKYDLTAMLRLSDKEYTRLVEVVSGMMCSVSKERACPTTSA